MIYREVYKFVDIVLCNGMLDKLYGFLKEMYIEREMEIRFYDLRNKL